MLKFKNLTHILLLLVTMTSALWCNATTIISTDGYSAIQINDTYVNGTPKGNTIQASIDGHWLSVTFTQNIGTLAMELEKVSGAVIFNYSAVPTPDSYQFYLNQTGDYIITFTLSNGDEYYGEFTVTD